ncbi:MAG: GNAT family N-acetyltransferase [Bacteroidetes bacterium HGW-Bacteroidetes-1]|nr:MAG: GNAT family N-acetyltransferase [Bacteroidetes bacterium HGW-Bacteroidetes-1]
MLIDKKAFLFESLLLIFVKILRAMDIVIRHEQNLRTGVFYVNHECDRMAFLSYFENPEGILLLNHTYVSPELRGQNVGSKLVEAAVFFARKNQFKIVPVCPYVVKWFEKNKDSKDVIFV